MGFPVLLWLTIVQDTASPYRGSEPPKAPIPLLQPTVSSPEPTDLGKISNQVTASVVRFRHHVEQEGLHIII